MYNYECDLSFSIIFHEREKKIDSFLRNQVKIRNKILLRYSFSLEFFIIKLFLLTYEKY